MATTPVKELFNRLSPEAQKEIEEELKKNKK